MCRLHPRPERDPFVLDDESLRLEVRADGSVRAGTPLGRTLRMEELRELAAEPALTLLCGRYEGLDERFVDREVDEELSIGDYVLSGGELERRGARSNSSRRRDSSAASTLSPGITRSVLRQTR